MHGMMERRVMEFDSDGSTPRLILDFLILRMFFPSHHTNHVPLHVSGGERNGRTGWLERLLVADHFYYGSHGCLTHLRVGWVATIETEATFTLNSKGYLFHSSNKRIYYKYKIIQNKLN